MLSVNGIVNKKPDKLIILSHGKTTLIVSVAHNYPNYPENKQSIYRYTCLQHYMWHD